ncbi:helix-turn-helix domain-containing protein [Faecalibaculum rodentium]|uniref:helix-turn-helix domain-containing protein n=1 Tax=Faecalibaculum rodentium TaxID=1702221 RepID=UPI00256EA5B8|nr:helix-turn-helix transcriptional regulator [Faecalibaculum rodentium]
MKTVDDYRKALEKFNNILKARGMVDVHLGDYNADRDAPEGPLLKDIRNELGISQKEVAEAIGIKSPTLATHEKREKVNESTKEKYLKIIGLSETDFNNLRLFCAMTLWPPGELFESEEEINGMLDHAEESRESNKRSTTVSKISGIAKRLNEENLQKLWDYSKLLLLTENIGIWQQENEEDIL